MADSRKPLAFPPRLALHYDFVVTNYTNSFWYGFWGFTSKSRVALV
jgi:hypothetical protein